MESWEKGLHKEWMKLIGTEDDELLQQSLKKLEVECKTYKILAIARQNFALLYDAILESKEDNVKNIIDDLVETKNKFVQFRVVAAKLEENNVQMDITLEIKAIEEEAKAQ